MQSRIALVLMAACSAAARAQSGGCQATPLPADEHPVVLPPTTDSIIDISWSTIDGGGRTLENGSLVLDATAGQPDAGVLSGGTLELLGGFQIPSDTPAPCYANCDGSSVSPVLTANDFQCFLNQYMQGTAYANCDGSTAPPVLNVVDFQCFLSKYAVGCS